MAVKLLTPLVATALATSSANALHPVQSFKTVLPKVKRQTKVAVLLPATLPTAGPSPHLYATGTGSAKGSDLELAGAPNCGGADACFIASFVATKGGMLPSRSSFVKLALAGGDPARYHPITCGGSCAPATLWFTHKGVLYSWQVKDAPRNAKTAMATAADSAIAAGPR
jgi:hypothetical protein